MIELERKMVGAAPYASYLLGEVEDMRDGFAGLHGDLIEAGLGDRTVRLTDGREVGVLAEWMTFPIEPTAKSFTIVTDVHKAKDAVPGYAVVGILFPTKEMRELAKDADLVVSGGQVVLKGSDEAQKTLDNRALLADAVQHIPADDLGIFARALHRYVHRPRR